MSDEDDKLWKALSKTVTPLAGKKIESGLNKTRPKKKEIKDKQDIVEPSRAPEYEKLPEIKVNDVVGVDKSTAKKLKDGKMEIEARLDLHGKTQEEAHQALHYFISTACSLNKRCVLIITGKGDEIRGTGVIKKEVPRWLNEPGLREHVLMFCSAKPQHGSTGAIYLLLRKSRGN